MKLSHILIPSDLSPDSLRPCEELAGIVSEVGKVHKFERSHGSLFEFFPCNFPNF